VVLVHQGHSDRKIIFFDYIIIFKQEFAINNELKEDGPIHVGSSFSFEQQANLRQKMPSTMFRKSTGNPEPRVSAVWLSSRSSRYTDSLLESPPNLS
jgi:hypothetical protein